MLMSKQLKFLEVLLPLGMFTPRILGIHSLHGVKGTLYSLTTMGIFKAVKVSMSIWPKGIECNIPMRVSSYLVFRRKRQILF